MPELPDLEVIRAVLGRELPGAIVASVEVRRPIIVRNLLPGDLAETLVGRRFTEVTRRGKFLLLSLDEGLTLVVNPMLAGRLRLGDPLPAGKDRKRDALVIGLADGRELRYNDQADMGKIYLARDLDAVPAFSGQGPEADDPALTLEAFRVRLRRYPGEIKGTLTNQAFIAGIGNAYADEILWCAQIYPFRRRASLSDAEVERLYTCMRAVLAKAVETLQERVGDRIEVEVRDFLAVHGKPGQSCPRCGGAISEVKREKRATHFCRACQPGLMVTR
jgi:formamidopyrimidine-DNA glycosylase